MNADAQLSEKVVSLDDLNIQYFVPAELLVDIRKARLVKSKRGDSRGYAIKASSPLGITEMFKKEDIKRAFRPINDKKKKISFMSWKSGHDYYIVRNIRQLWYLAYIPKDCKVIFQRAGQDYVANRGGQCSAGDYIACPSDANGRPDKSRPYLIGNQWAIRMFRFTREAVEFAFRLASETPDNAGNGITVNMQAPGLVKEAYEVGCGPAGSDFSKPADSIGVPVEAKRKPIETPPVVERPKKVTYYYIGSNIRLEHAVFNAIAVNGEQRVVSFKYGAPLEKLLSSGQDVRLATAIGRKPMGDGKHRYLIRYADGTERVAPHAVVGIEATQGLIDNLYCANVGGTSIVRGKGGTRAGDLPSF